MPLCFAACFGGKSDTRSPEKERSSPHPGTRACEGVKKELFGEGQVQPVRVQESESAKSAAAQPAPALALETDVCVPHHDKNHGRDEESSKAVADVAESSSPDLADDASSEAPSTPVSDSSTHFSGSPTPSSVDLPLSAIDSNLEVSRPEGPKVPALSLGPSPASKKVPGLNLPSMSGPIIDSSSGSPPTLRRR